MRYMDWDVLLFPGDQPGKPHVPLQEFRTACYTEYYDNPAHVTPLLTTFVPSLPAGRPFQISLHSWSETKPILSVSSMNEDATEPTELWQVKVVIDGICVCTEKYPVQANWPQSIIPTTSDALGEVTLLFPPFHRAIMSQNYWDASDQVGRIRVELAAGYEHPKQNGFMKIANLVNFAFQPAPLDLLEYSGIAWPNPRQLANSHHGNGNFRHQPGFSTVSTPMKHKPVMSANAGVVLPSVGLVPRVSGAPLNPLVQDSDSNYDGSGRSSSAYSLVPETAAPLLQMSFPNLTESTRKDQQASWRLPSDQLGLILSAIQPPQQVNENSNGTMKMAPPPLPTQMVSKATNFPDQSELPVAPNGDQLPTPIFNDRRGETRYSDVSMHAACNDFPSCTSEDDEGRIVHSTPSIPTTVVKGRKEGSSPTKPRDFCSTILDTMALTMSAPTATFTKGQSGLLSSIHAHDGPGKKRTRSALKSLSLNDVSRGKNEVVKPPRKASKASTSSSTSDKENILAVSEGQEMIMDA